MKLKTILAAAVSPAVAPVLFLVGMKLISGYELQGPGHSHKLYALTGMMLAGSYLLTLVAMLSSHLIISAFDKGGSINFIALAIGLSMILSYVVSKTQKMSESWFFVALSCLAVTINLAAFFLIKNGKKRWRG